MTPKDELLTIPTLTPEEFYLAMTPESLNAIAGVTTLPETLLIPEEVATGGVNPEHLTNGNFNMTVPPDIHRALCGEPDLERAIDVEVLADNYDYGRFLALEMLIAKQLALKDITDYEVAEAINSELIMIFQNFTPDKDIDEEIEKRVRDAHKRTRGSTRELMKTFTREEYLNIFAEYRNTRITQVVFGPKEKFIEILTGSAINPVDDCDFSIRDTVPPDCIMAIVNGTIEEFEDAIAKSKPLSAY